MGLFCLPNGDKSSDLVEAAIGNLQLFMEGWKHDRGEMTCSGSYPNDYMLEMAMSYLQDAQDKYKEECDNNPLLNSPQSIAQVKQIVDDSNET